MRSLRATAAAVISVVVLGGACAPAASGGSGSYAPELRPGGAAVPTLRVTNNNWSTMTVYAVRGTSRVRLGMVTSMASAVFRLPASLLSSVGGVRLLADPIGGSETFLTPPVYVNRGEEVQLDLQNNLPISSVSVWGQR